MMPHPRPSQPPTPGRIVLYRSPSDLGQTFPAVVVAAPSGGGTDDDRVPAFTAIDRLHLVVLTPILGRATFGVYDVPEDADVGDGHYSDEHEPGTWRWPRFR